MSSGYPDRRAIIALRAIPTIVALLAMLAPITTDPLVLFGGISYQSKPNWLPGFSTIDPNQGFTAFALGVRATIDLLAGRLPLWNPYEGLGSPLLGEMQAAALFPPTLLLALPHGQLIEQTFLQIVAGIGTYLFLRRFGLGVTAAFAGGLLFEFNGVFAWLRNAIYNPVALLPWLFYVVETLFVVTGQPLRQRATWIVLGAVAASLALYAGFPEVVFFYAFPLSGWLAFRAAGLPWRQALAYLGDHVVLAVIALLLTAPLLLAFGHFLTEANVGDHQHQGFKDAVINPGGAVMYLLPYLYGPISAAANPAIASLWANGGYLGLTAFVLAIGGVITHHRRPLAWLLAGWIAFAVGVSHGVPPLLAIMQRLPLTTEAVFSRYLNTGWLFCAVTLAAMFVDRLPALSWTRQRQFGTASVGIAIVLLGIAIALTWPTLSAAWQPHQGQRLSILISLAAAALLLLGVIAATWLLRPGRASIALTALVAVEAVTLYAVPFASSPRSAQVDMQLVTFLQRNAGLQRVATAIGDAIVPNFGSAFGISTINYDDLPVPARTVEYVRRALQPTVMPIMFRPNVEFRHDTLAGRRDEFLAHQSGYADAGVRYVLATPDFFDEGPSLLEAGTRAVDLADGETVTLSLVSSPRQTTIEAVKVLIGTYSGQSDGRLTARICQRDRCEDRSAALANALNNVPLAFNFDPPFALTGGAYRLGLSKQGGEHPVALWSKPPAPGETARASGLPGIDGLVPKVTFVVARQLRPVLSTKTTTVFELAAVRAYASAPYCTVDASSHEQMTADCARPSRLTRLEVMMQGWTAQVNGAVTPVTLAEDTFQAIDLPAGHADIAFVYAPSGVRPALWIALATIVLLAGLLAAGRGSGPRN